MEETNQSNGSKRIYLAIIALLLLINGVAIYMLVNENKQKEQIVHDTGAKISQDSIQIKDMTAQLDNAHTEMESQKGKNAELDSIISARQHEIESIKNQLMAAQKRGNVTSGELQKYKDMVAKIQLENAELQKKIQDLTAKNEDLTAKNLQVNQDLQKEKTTTASLTEDKANLSKKVELGSLLQLQNLKVEGVHKRHNGKEVGKKSAKHIDYLKITFATGDNKVLEKGALALYVRIINPKGETIAIADQGSGKVKLNTGDEVQYSKKVDLDWDQNSKNVAVEWSQNIKDPGTYKVEVYQSGYEVGKGSIELK
jgi:predicted RNase H-like nuclease (RuvC/YqgF family)